MDTQRRIGQSVNEISRLLSSAFDPQRQVYRSGVAEFRVRLEQRSPATEAEVLEIFWWISILVVRYRESPTEIEGAILFVGGEIRAYWALLFPGIRE